MGKVLVVDDSASDRYLVEVFLKEDPQLKLTFASDGRQALLALDGDRPDVVLTDLHMPGMDGLELVQRIRAGHPKIPVILMTAFGSEDLAMRALRSGAASYVAKKNLQENLLETVTYVLGAASTTKEEERALGCLTQAESRFVLENDETLITPLCGLLEADLRRLEFGDDTDLIRVAVALREALINAMHHGNLEVSSEVQVHDAQEYDRLLAERRGTDPYQQRRIHLTATVTPAAASYVIRDDGPGFDPSCVPDPTDPANLEKSRGRGLLLISTFMDEVYHNENGNQITMSIRARRGGEEESAKGMGSSVTP